MWLGGRRGQQLVCLQEYNGVAKLVIANALEAARLSVVNKHNSAKSAESRPAEALKPAKAKTGMLALHRK